MQFEHFPKTKVAYLKVKCASEAKDAFYKLHKCLHEHIDGKTKYFGWKHCCDCQKDEFHDMPYRFGISVPAGFDEHACHEVSVMEIHEGRIAYQHHVGPYESIDMCCCHQKEEFTKMGLKCKGSPFYMCINDPSKVAPEQLEQKLCWQIE